MVKPDRVTAASITDDQIRTVQHGAYLTADLKTAEICRLALTNGHQRRGNRARVARLINERNGYL